MNKFFWIVLIFVFFFHPQFSTGKSDELKRVAVIVTMPVPACEAHLKYFIAQLNDLGYQDGKNIELTIIRANGDRQFAEEQLKRLMKTGNLDAVVTIATLASQAAFNVLKDTKVPIFFFQVSDPVGAGLIKKTGESTGTNVSGRIFTVPRDVWVDLALRLVGQTISEKRPIRFGYIYSSYPSSMGDIRDLKIIEEKRNDIKFESYLIPYQKVPAGIPAMIKDANLGIQAISDKVDFWWEPQGPLGELNEYTQLLLNHSTIRG